MLPYKTLKNEYVKLYINSRESETVRYAFSDGELINLELYVSKKAALKSVRIISKGKRGWLNCSHEIDNFEYDVFSYTLKCSELGIGLHYFYFELEAADGKYYYLYSDISGYVSSVKNEDHCFMFLIYDKNYSTPSWLKGTIMYQIFPDRFAKGGKVPCRNDVQMNNDWYDGIPQYVDKPTDKLLNNMFFGGTLYGIVDKLDYLESLGVNCIYLNPIFKAYSNHKYDTGDYMQVDEMFGGDEALLQLVEECKKRDIHIILDGVFNHTGDNSLYFNKYGDYDSVGAYQSKDSKYYKWYNFMEWNDTYESWWGIDILPRINCDEPSYNEFINGKDGVVRKYLNMGVSGWRLDVVDELSDDFVKNLRAAAKDENKDAMIYGEVWEDAVTKISYGKLREYFWGKEIDSVMNYPLKNAIIDYLLYSNADILYYSMQRLYNHYPKCSLDVLMNILGTHDTKRILTVLAGSPLDKASNREKSVAKLTNEERSFAKKRLTLAVCILMTMPGVPCIFYGDEAGMEGYDDPFNRRPYPWGMEDKEIVGCYRRFAAARLSSHVYAEGDYRCLAHDGGLFAFERFDDTQSNITVTNCGHTIRRFEFEGTMASILTGTVYDGYIDIMPMTCDILSNKSF